MYFHKGIDELGAKQVEALRATLLEDLPLQNAAVEAKIKEIRGNIRAGLARTCISKGGREPGGHLVREHRSTRNSHAVARKSRFHEELADLERALVEGEVALRKMQRACVINDSVRAITV